MTDYSGRTTAYGHKFGDWEKNGKNIGDDCIKQITLFDVQWSNCPVEVEEEVMRLWRDHNFGNDHYFYKWDGQHEDADRYPIIAEYLESRGVTECLINWWW